MRSQRQLLSVLLFLASLLLPALATCAAQSETALTQAACGPQETRWHTDKSSSAQPLPEKPGSAILYFITRFQSQGGELGCGAVTRNGVDGQWVGANCGSSWTATYLTPGMHHLCVDLQPGLAGLRATGLWALSAEAGQTYYLQSHVQFLGGIEDSFIDLLNLDEGKLLVATLPASTSRQKK